MIRFSGNFHHRPINCQASPHKLTAMGNVLQDRAAFLKFFFPLAPSFRSAFSSFYLPWLFFKIPTGLFPARPCVCFGTVEKGWGNIHGFLAGSR
jgi:hypothetical protein